MRIVLQRVKSASVSIEGSVVGEINQGFLLLVGVGPEDTNDDAGIDLPLQVLPVQSTLQNSMKNSMRNYVPSMG